MKRFKFRLQAVLEQRERLETHAKSTYAEAQQAVQKAEVLLAELTEVRAALLNEVAEQRKAANFDPLEARLYQDYLNTIVGCIRDQEAYVRELQIDAEALRLNLVGASTNRKVIDKIRERDQSAHHAQAARAEQASADEMITMRHARNAGLRPAQ
ncbi:MAG TPA: flagellar export protein FliJ [Capsulimonadaceae bacterium]|nr:flagellar export protein FliJ [Capsulimonadaceae bacterium]